MKKTICRIIDGPVVFATALLILLAVNAGAVVNGITGTSFSFTAKTDYISTPDGASVPFWGYANNDGTAQYPGPTLIVNQGETITIELTNHLQLPVSIVFPGQTGITATPQAGSTQQGLLTLEANTGGTVSYTFTAAQPGTYLYHSGTRPELEVEMGLFGAIIVRPAGFTASAPRAYAHVDTSYDNEYLFLLSEMDIRIHNLVHTTPIGTLDAALAATDYFSDYFPSHWFINGRCAPDTMLMAGVPWLPTQPYNCMPRMNPGDKMLMRLIDAGRDLHPFHHHGNHARVIAKDGRLLESVPGAGPDLSYLEFTIQAIPGETVDAIFEWTGKDLGWDIYGNNDPTDTLGYNPHSCNPDAEGFDVTTREWCADHYIPIPVALPNNLALTFGGFWSGSPYLGAFGSLPPGEGGLNPNAGYTYMWHSHTEKEMTNYDIFPGGMMTMLLIEPPGVVIP